MEPGEALEILARPPSETLAARLARRSSFLGRRGRVADRRSRPLVAIGDLGETPVEPVTEFVGVVVVLGPALAGDDHAGSGHARQASDSYELPGHPHGP
jgi:hypothetical protein